MMCRLDLPWAVRRATLTALKPGGGFAGFRQEGPALAEEAGAVVDGFYA